MCYLCQNSYSNSVNTVLLSRTGINIPITAKINLRGDFMCTSTAIRKGGFCFGRNMDIDYSFGEGIIITPRKFSLEFKKIPPLSEHYAFIGTGTVKNNMPLYAEGMNEKGLCIAALKFPDNALYCEESADERSPVAPYEIIPYILGKCSNIKEAATLLTVTDIINEPFDGSTPLSPLHWHISDKEGSITVEQTREGMKIYDNPFDVLTNNPPFPFHRENLTLYLGLTPRQPEGEKASVPFGLGFGAVGLPGDFTPASRFVRERFLLKNSPSGINPVIQLFHILGGVSIPKGAVITPDAKFHYTTYTCCMETESLTYYYRTYRSASIWAVKMTEETMSGNELISFPQVTESRFFFQN